MFLVVGIVILLIIVLFFSFKDFLLEKISSQGKQPLNVEKQLESKMNAISDKIDSCVKSEGDKAVALLSEQGGYFELLRFRSYYKKNVATLCAKYDPNQLCFNLVPPKSAVEQNLDQYLQEKIINCVKISSFKTTDINLEYEKPVIKTTINKDNVMFDLLYPINLVKDKQQFSKDKFIIILNNPLGKFLDIANKVVGDESTEGDFDIAGFAVNDPGWIVKPNAVGNYVVYNITDYYEKYSFVFGVEK